MVDITLQVMINAPTHDLSYDPEKNARRHRNGDIIDVHNPSQHATLIGGEWKWNEAINSPRSVFIHVRGLPSGLARLARQRLSDQIKAAGEIMRIRRYRLPPSVIPTQVRDALLVDREFTITWAQAKSVIRKKVISIPLDASQDDETTELVDGDLL